MIIRTFDLAPTVTRREAAEALHNLDAEGKRLRAAVEAVLRLHIADAYGDCCECGNFDAPHNVPWPCPTIRDIRTALGEVEAR